MESSTCVYRSRVKVCGWVGGVVLYVVSTLLAAAAKAVATVITYPMQLAKTNLQAKEKANPQAAGGGYLEIYAHGWRREAAWRYSRDWKLRCGKQCSMLPSILWPTKTSLDLSTRCSIALGDDLDRLTLDMLYEQCISKVVMMTGPTVAHGPMACGLPITCDLQSLSQHGVSPANIDFRSCLFGV